MIKYKGADIRIFKSNTGYYYNLKYGYTICEPDGYFKEWSEEESIIKAKNRIDELC